MRIKHSIVIPAYNESLRIGATLESIVEYRAETSVGNPDFEVIVVCDGCRDATERVVRPFADHVPIRVVSYPDNRGKGYAVRQGIAVSKGDVVAFMDADGSTPVRELGRLADLIHSNQADIVIGSRRAEGSLVTADQPVLRQLLGRAFAMHAQMVLGLRIRDTQCGFKVFRGQVARELFKDFRCDGFAFDLELLAVARERRLRVLERGVEWNERPGSTVNPLRDGVRMLRAAWQIRARLRARRGIKVAEWPQTPLVQAEPLCKVTSI